MAAYIKMEGIKGESTNVLLPEDDFVFHPLTQVDDYTTEDPFDMAPPEGETLFHPYAASEDKAVETIARSGGGEVAEQFDGRTEAFADGPVEPVDPEVDEHDPQEPAGAEGDGDGGDFILWDVVDGAAGAEGGGNDGSNGGDIILWDIVDSIAADGRVSVTQASDDEFVFVRWSASEDKTIGGDGATADSEDGGGDAGDIILWDIVDSIADGGDAAAGGGNDGDDLDIILWDIIDGVAASDDAPVEAGIAFHEPVIVEDFNIGGLLCDYG